MDMPISPPAPPPSYSGFQPTSIENRPIDYDETYNEYSALRLNYARRRFDYFKESNRPLPVYAIARMPLPYQVAFRLKMLTLVALQLLVVVCVVTTFRFQSQAKRLADDVFTPPSTGRLVLASVVGLVLLVTLYLVRNRSPLNWVLLLLFTCVQSLCCVGLGVAWDSNVAIFNCVFTFVSVVIMIALSGVERKTQPPTELPQTEATTNTETTLMSTRRAGMIAYVVSAMVASVLFLVYGRDLVTNKGFYYSLGFQLVLLLWLAYDTTVMYQIISADEYMHGVIYMYIDLVLAVLLAVMSVGFLIGAAVYYGCNGLCGCWSKKKKAENQPSGSTEVQG